MYKISQYNYFVPYRDKILYYNSIRRSSFVMTLAEHQKIRKLFEDPVSFGLEFPSIFAQFYNWGFFTDSYTDETAVFRYLYNRDIIFNSNYHLVLVNTAKQEFSSGFVEAVAKHINQTLCSKEIKRICIEWRGYNILDTFDDRIQPLFNRAKKMCKIAGTELTGQIEVNLSNNAVIHNKLYHKKGIPTYETTLQTIRHITTKYPEYRLRVHVSTVPSDPVAKEDFLQQFGNLSLKRIHWIWAPHKKNKPAEEENSIATFMQNRLNEDYEEINPELTYPWLAPRKNAVVIYPNNKVYMSVPFDSHQEPEAQGVLNETDGIIQWNEPEREKILSQMWFERKLCNSCKHLPLLSQVCPLLIIKSGIICPIDNKLIDPETIIIKEFESKQQ